MSNNEPTKSENPQYPFPIPERETILQFLKTENKPANKVKIANAFGLDKPEEQDALHRRLRAMERDGQLVFTRRKCYALPEKLDLVKGYVIGHREGYGFLKIDAAKRDLYLSQEQMRKVMHGDLILAQPLGYDHKGRSEARVVRVLEPAEPMIVGRYFNDGSIGFVMPDDSRIQFDILIPQAAPDIQNGSMVVAELMQRPPAKAVGRITEVLGTDMDGTLAMNIAIRSHRIPTDWSEATLEQIQHYTANVPESDKQGRVDLRNLPLVTIDGEDARDFDDAVYCTKNRGGGWRLWVAIADVSYYVRPNTPLDNDACERGTSVYFPSKVIPMLPEILSNGLCSLNPKTDRLCLVCEMTISRSGNLTSYRFYDAVMNSHARLTYTKVAKILTDNDPALCEEYADLVPDLHHLYALYKALEEQRTQRGAISFETEEPFFVFNENKQIESIRRLQRNDAHKIIEECMILANVSAAKFVESAKTPALYRVHDVPTEENLTKVRTILSELGLSLQVRDKPTPADYANFMLLIAERPDHEMLETMLLRSMKQAIYDPENRGHFGLALQSYAHFTSPIRRYPDLLLHRVIKYLIAKQQDPAPTLPTQTGGFHYPMPEMIYFGEHCSMTERRADEATRDVTDWLKCDYMQKHVGETFNGIITSVVNFGFFVRLDDLFIDGLVHVSTLDNDYYVFDPVRQSLTGESSKQIYRLGDKVVVTVAAVHMEERNIDFALVSAERGPLRTGKTAKSRLKKHHNESSFGMKRSASPSAKKKPVSNVNSADRKRSADKKSRKKRTKR